MPGDHHTDFVLALRRRMHAAEEERDAAIARLGEVTIEREAAREERDNVRGAALEHARQLLHIAEAVDRGALPPSGADLRRHADALLARIDPDPGDPSAPPPYPVATAPTCWLCPCDGAEGYAADAEAALASGWAEGDHEHGAEAVDQGAATPPVSAGPGLRATSHAG